MVLKIKLKPSLVMLSGCLGCSKLCKYNNAIADPLAAGDAGSTLYGCNSSLVGFKLDEGESYVA